MTSRRMLAIIGIVLVFCLGLVYILLPKSEEVSVELVKRPETKKEITISNAAEYEGRIDRQNLSVARGRVYEYLKLSGADVSPQPSGEVRPGTYKQITNSYGTATEFMVDFPNLKRSYKVTYSDDKSGYRALFIVCPVGSELRYEAVKCIGDGNE